MSEWDAFDRELAESLEELPPPDAAVRAVTPWRDAMDRIVLGLCLNCFTLNFWYLQYILPAAGTVQLYLGLRTLRKNNRWFQAAWYISIWKVFILYINYTLQATPATWAMEKAAENPWAVFLALPTLLLFFCLRQGLRQAASELGRTAERDPLLWTMGWYAVMTALALFWPQPGWPVFLATLYAFYRIVKALYRLTEVLENWGYTVRAALVKVSAKRLKAVCYLSLLVLIVVCALFSNHIRVDGTPVEQNFDSQTTAIQTHLQELGFPEEYLSQLPAAELQKLTEADLCYVHQSDGDPAAQDTVLKTIFVRVAPRTVRTYQFFATENWRSLLRNQVLIDQSDDGVTSDLTAQITWTAGSGAYYTWLTIDSQDYITYFGDTRHTHSATFSYPLFSSQRQGWIASTSAFDEVINDAAFISYRLQSLKQLYPYQDITGFNFHESAYTPSGFYS